MEMREADSFESDDWTEEDVTQYFFGTEHY